MTTDELLHAFEPSAADPWDRGKAGHLARRAGFGATLQELDELVALGPDGAVARFVDFPDVDTALEAEMEAVGGELTEGLGPKGTPDFQQVQRLRRAWVYRMVRGNFPLQEKLTLLWHDHFACQENVVLRGALLQAQNELFRRLAAAPFGELLAGVARDPAMLVFLDNRLSTRENPNENWARELVELFTLGLDQYTQRDIVELARIFTGWTTPAKHEAVFAFRPDRHDASDKVLFGAPLAGRSGPEGVAEGEEALARILSHGSCAPFLAGKLLAWFVSHEVEPSAANALGDALRASDFNVRETLRKLFSSAWFYTPERRLQRVKNPVELVVGAARRLGLQNPHLASIPRHVRELGMHLFFPPSVAGWNHGEAWIDSGSTLRRHDLAFELSELPHTRRQVLGRAAANFDAFLPDANADDRAVVDAIADALLDFPLPEAKRRIVTRALGEVAAPRSASPAKRHRRRVRAAVHLVLASPEALIA
ncbi:MAG: DUF1800 domain-containing protein [bacterium]|nr:DUF1800 domain-containing protein [bacterium]